MPKRLIDRCQPDSIHEFRLAAEERFLDGLYLADGGRRTGAVYVWGYAAEMVLKATYFDAIGFAAKQAIGMADLRAAVATAAAAGIVWQGNLHNIESWAELLLSVRIASPTASYTNPAFSRDVMLRSHTIGQTWREVLRYRKNVARAFEVKQVGDATAWLMSKKMTL